MHAVPSNEHQLVLVRCVQASSLYKELYSLSAAHCMMLCCGSGWEGNCSCAVLYLECCVDRGVEVAVCTYEGGQCHVPAWCYCQMTGSDRRVLYVCTLGRVLLQHSAACLWCCCKTLLYLTVVVQLFPECVTASVRSAAVLPLFYWRRSWTGHCRILVHWGLGSTAVDGLQQTPEGAMG